MGKNIHEEAHEYASKISKHAYAPEAAVIAYIAGAERDNWVRVEDGLPENDTWVLVYMDSDEMECCNTVAYYNCDTFIGEDDSLSTPTHWQPLPPNPKK